MCESLDKKVAVVTGGTRGIGWAISCVLLAKGARVFAGSVNTRATGGADENASKQIAAQLSELSADKVARLTLLPLDVTSNDSITHFLSSVVSEADYPAILVNCAGISHHQSVEEHDDHAWQQVLDVNLTGAYRMTKACLPGMKRKRWGRIINIASTAAHTGHPGYAAYCASKAGLLGLTRTVAVEGAADGINCVSVSPTWVETDMLHATASETAAEKGTEKEQVLAEIAASNPQGRIVGPAEIASLVSFLCADGTAGLTMEDIQINAGAHW